MNLIDFIDKARDCNTHNGMSNSWLLHSDIYFRESLLSGVSIVTYKNDPCVTSNQVYYKSGMLVYLKLTQRDIIKIESTKQVRSIELLLKKCKSGVPGTNTFY